MVRDAALRRGRAAAARDSLPEGQVPTPAALVPDDSTALLEYVTGALGAPTTAFLVTRAAPAVGARILPPADSVTGAIGRFVALVAKGEESRDDASALARLLVEPLLASLPPGITRLVIVPDGPLHRVPWDALRLADAARLGALCNASHESMRDDYEISTPEIDTLVRLARQREDVYGARMTGGGFGGAVIVIARSEANHDAAEQLARAYHEATGRDGTVLVPE